MMQVYKGQNERDKSGRGEGKGREGRREERREEMMSILRRGKERGNDVDLAASPRCRSCGVSSLVHATFGDFSWPLHLFCMVVLQLFFDTFFNQINKNIGMVARRRGLR
jgi:hypothetical protein